MIYKFSENAGELDTISNSKAYKAHEALVELGGYRYLDDLTKSYLNTVFSQISHPETYSTGKHKIMGYVIDFNEWLNTYWVKYKLYGILEVRSFNKTFLRKNNAKSSDIQRIMEVK